MSLRTNTHRGSSPSDTLAPRLHSVQKVAVAFGVSKSHNHIITSSQQPFASKPRRKDNVIDLTGATSSRKSPGGRTASGSKSSQPRSAIKSTAQKGNMIYKSNISNLQSTENAKRAEGTDTTTEPSLINAEVVKDMKPIHLRRTNTGDNGHGKALQDTHPSEAIFDHPDGAKLRHKFKQVELRICSGQLVSSDDIEDLMEEAIELNVPQITIALFEFFEPDHFDLDLVNRLRREFGQHSIPSPVPAVRCPPYTYSAYNLVLYACILDAQSDLAVSLLLLMSMDETILESMYEDSSLHRLLNLSNRYPLMLGEHNNVLFSLYSDLCYDVARFYGDDVQTIHQHFEQFVDPDTLIPQMIGAADSYSHRNIGGFVANPFHHLPTQPRPRVSQDKLEKRFGEVASAPGLTSFSLSLALMACAHASNTQNAKALLNLVLWHDFVRVSPSHIGSALLSVYSSSVFDRNLFISMFEDCHSRGLPITREVLLNLIHISTERHAHLHSLAYFDAHFAPLEYQNYLSLGRAALATHEPRRLMLEQHKTVLQTFKDRNIKLWFDTLSQYYKQMYDSDGGAYDIASRFGAMLLPFFLAAVSHSVNQQNNTASDTTTSTHTNAVWESLTKLGWGDNDDDRQALHVNPVVKPIFYSVNLTLNNLRGLPYLLWDPQGQPAPTLWRESLLLTQVAQSFGFEPDRYTYSTSIQAAINAGRTDVVLFLSHCLIATRQRARLRLVAEVIDHLAHRPLSFTHTPMLESLFVENAMLLPDEERASMQGYLKQLPHLPPHGGIILGLMSLAFREPIDHTLHQKRLAVGLSGEYYQGKSFLPTHIDLNEPLPDVCEAESEDDENYNLVRALMSEDTQLTSPTDDSTPTHPSQRSTGKSSLGGSTTKHKKDQADPDFQNIAASLDAIQQDEGMQQIIQLKTRRLFQESTIHHFMQALCASGLSTIALGATASILGLTLDVHPDPQRVLAKSAYFPSNYGVESSDSTSRRSGFRIIPTHVREYLSRNCEHSRSLAYFLGEAQNAYQCRYSRDSVHLHPHMTPLSQDWAQKTISDVLFASALSSTHMTPDDIKSAPDDISTNIFDILTYNESLHRKDPRLQSLAVLSTWAAAQLNPLKPTYMSYMGHVAALLSIAHLANSKELLESIVKFTSGGTPDERLEWAGIDYGITVQLPSNVFGVSSDEIMTTSSLNVSSNSGSRVHSQKDSGLETPEGRTIHVTRATLAAVEGDSSQRADESSSHTASAVNAGSPPPTQQRPKRRRGKSQLMLTFTQDLAKAEARSGGSKPYSGSSPHQESTIGSAVICNQNYRMDLQHVYLLAVEQFVKHAQHSPASDPTEADSIIETATRLYNLAKGRFNWHDLVVVDLHNTLGASTSPSSSPPKETAIADQGSNSSANSVKELLRRLPNPSPYTPRGYSGDHHSLIEMQSIHINALVSQSYSSINGDYKRGESTTAVDGAGATQDLPHDDLRMILQKPFYLLDFRQMTPAHAQIAYSHAMTQLSHLKQQTGVDTHLPLLLIVGTPQSRYDFPASTLLDKALTSEDKDTLHAITAQGGKTIHAFTPLNDDDTTDSVQFFLLQ